MSILTNKFLQKFVVSPLKNSGKEKWSDATEKFDEAQ